MSKTRVTLEVNTIVTERFFALARARKLSPNFLAGVALSQFCDEFENDEANEAFRADNAYSVNLDGD